MAPAHRAGMQHHAELPPAAVLRVELRAPVAEQIVRMFQPGATAREQQKPLIVEMIIIRQRQHRSPRGRIRHPVMRNIVRQPVSHVLVPGIDQQIHRVRADRSSSERVLLPRQAEPAGRPPSRRPGQDLGRQIETLLFVRLGKSADVFMLQSVRRDLMPLRKQRSHAVGTQRRDDRRHGEGRLDTVAPEHRKELVQPIMRREESIRMRQILGANAFRPARHAEIHHDGDTTAVAIGPAYLAVAQAHFVGDRIALFPGHRLRSSLRQGNWSGSAWQLPRRWRTTHPATSSSA